MQLKNQKTPGQSRLARMSKIFINERLFELVKSLVNTHSRFEVLAKGTARMAQNMMLFHQIEGELESEMEKDKKRAMPTTKVGKLRRNGEHFLHGKYVLLAVVILNVIDCLLVLGELMLDIKYVTDLLTTEYARSEEFIHTMKNLYPKRLGHLGPTDIEALENEILRATLIWDNDTHAALPNGFLKGQVFHAVQNTTPMQMTPSSVSPRRSVMEGMSSQDEGNDTYHTTFRFINSEVDQKDSSREVEIVKGLHKTSISILIILVCETIFKIFCFGKQMWKHKLECFDGFVVISSFIVDVVFIKGIQQFTVQEYILILAFIVPWRIIRVVNSLVVAINCHEHFRLVVVYKQTKKISAELKEVKKDNKRLEAHVETLMQMCVDAGFSKCQITSKLDGEQRKKKDSSTSRGKGEINSCSTDNSLSDTIKDSGLPKGDKPANQTMESFSEAFTNDNDTGDIDNIVVTL